MQRIKNRRVILGVFFLLISSLYMKGCASGTPNTTEILNKNPLPLLNVSIDTRKTTKFRAQVGAKGMVVSADRIASDWGAEVLRKGGNAVDAAVATIFALSVTRPMYSSLGGGGFMLYCPSLSRNGKKRDCSMVDFREKAPSAAYRNLFTEKFRNTPYASTYGAIASGVPGLVAGMLLAQSKWGKLPRKALLSRPIQLAQRGTPMSGISEWAARIKWKKFNDAAKRVLSCHRSGKNNKYSPIQPCEPGGMIIQKNLAKVLIAISKQGTGGFYRGWVGEKIAKAMKENNGLITKKDLRNYNAKIRKPLQTTFMNHEVVSAAPPSAGGANLIQILKYTQYADEMKMFDQGFGSVPTIHAQAHAMALAFADRAAYFGDQDFTSYPLKKLLSDAYLRKRWDNTFVRNSAHIPEEAGDPKPSKIAFKNESLETTHISVIDRDGNAVSVTVSDNSYYGSGFVIPGTGIFMNNHMDDFVSRPGSANKFGLTGSEANTIRPGKRPLSSMTPTIVRTKEGQNKIVIGAAGGPRITTATYQILMNRLRFQMSLPDAMVARRIHHQWRPMNLMLEAGSFTQHTLNELESMGYLIDHKKSLARAQALERYPDGIVWGMTDPREEGAASAE